MVRVRPSSNHVNTRLLTLAQDSFVKNGSCPIDLLMFLDETTRRLDEGKVGEICDLDFSKALGSISHLLDHRLQLPI